MTPTNEIIEPLKSDLEERDAEIKRLRSHLKVIESILGSDGECDCELDQCDCHPWPEESCYNDPDEPSHHKQYCDRYLAAYVTNLLAGDEHPNPDSKLKNKKESTK